MQTIVIIIGLMVVGALAKLISWRCIAFYLGERVVIFARTGALSDWEAVAVAGLVILTSLRAKWVERQAGKAIDAYIASRRRQPSPGD